MILWLNGAFGVGKTTTADRLVRRLPEFRLFDPEWVGYLLRANLADHRFTDFQQLPPWRALVPAVADEIARFTGQHLVTVQTVLEETYWQEIHYGFTRRGQEVRHVLLDADEDTLHARIDADENGLEIRKWRHDHVERYTRARSWLLDAADVVVDTSTAGPDTVVDRITEAG